MKWKVTFKFWWFNSFNVDSVVWTWRICYKNFNWDVIVCFKTEEQECLFNEWWKFVVMQKFKWFENFVLIYNKNRCLKHGFSKWDTRTPRCSPVNRKGCVTRFTLRQLTGYLTRETRIFLLPFVTTYLCLQWVSLPGSDKKEIRKSTWC